MRSRLLRYAILLIAAAALWVALLFAAGAVVQSRVPVNLPAFAGVTPISEGYIKASGTWVIDGDQQGVPLQTTEISCERELKRGTSATAQVMLGNQLTAHLDTYEVVSWERNRVVFVDNEPNCVSYIFTIDLATKSVAGVRRRKPDGQGALGSCAEFEKELRLYLRQGGEVSRRLQNEAVPWFGQVVFAPLKLLH